MEGSETHDEVRQQILQALRHQEAEAGLFFRNFVIQHEADERPEVFADPNCIMVELESLVRDGIVHLEQQDTQVVFSLQS